METTYRNAPALYMETAAIWRQWLEAHHQQRAGVYLILYKKASGTPSVTYTEALDEALCFGWIDSKINKRDAVSFYQYFAPRSLKSNWSLVNRKKVAALTAAGKMAPAGLAMVEQAKALGTWTALDAVEAGILPPELENLLQANPEAAAYFNQFPRSVKRGILEWIYASKSETTRNKRIHQTVMLAAQNKRANFPG